MTQLTRADLARRKEQKKLREQLGGRIPDEIEELFRYTCPRLVPTEFSEEETSAKKPPPKRRPSLLF